MNVLAPILACGVGVGDLSGWESHPVMVGQDHIGTVINKGAEIHVAFSRPLPCRNAIRAILGKLIDEYGYVTTRVVAADMKAHSFVRRVGFKATWTDGRFIYYLLAAVPFTKE